MYLTNHAVKKYNFIWHIFSIFSRWGMLTFFVLGFYSLRANSIVEIPQLKDQNIVISQAIDFHILHDSEPFINSTISINNNDAMLFFDNIRPSEVKATLLPSILVNGEPLAEGSNARIAIYGHGTVIMSHSSGFKPLTVFSEDNFEGDSLQLFRYDYNTDFAVVNNSVKSFKLKRGYMATLATSPDGMGYSRVFIADKEDLNIDKLQAELYGNVAFIRVFNHQWVSKKGWAGWSDYEIRLANVTCYYDWNVGGTTSENFEYTPIRQNGGWPSWGAINGKTNVSHLLGFNEPDRPDQANMTFEQMIDIWPGMMQSGLRIGSPAWSNPWGGNGGNLFDFINKCDELNYRVDFVALHCYWGGKSPENWYNDLKYIHEATGRPLWITEWNNGANWTNEWWPDATWELTASNAQKQLNDLKGILNVLDTAHFVERYFIYNWVEDRRAIILNGELTPAGEYYASNESQIAYNKSNDVVMGKWKYEKPTLNYRYLTLSDILKLSWEDENEEMTAGFKLEKKINDGEYTTLLETSDKSVTFFNDQLDSINNGTITYRLSVLTVYGEYVSSNEIAYYLLADENKVKFANFSIDDKEWKSCMFTNEYEETPKVIMGTPTLKNAFGLTSRTNSLRKNSFTFHLGSWNYQADRTMTRAETIGMLSIASGTYDFGGLQAVANEVSEVNSNWISVEFENEFKSIPVVFCTQASSKSIIPTTPVVRNVTTTGFELAISCEEAMSEALIKEETVHFLAIEKGNGYYNNKRISVGGTTADEAGIADTPFEITYDDRIKEPAIFARLQSRSDEFASTLRILDSNHPEFSLVKHRELSGTPSKMAEDQVGWLVVDLLDGQNVGIEEKLQDQTIGYYPNPATNQIFFESNNIKNIKILNLSGSVVLQKTAEQQLNIENLPAGSYLINIDGIISKLLVY